MIAVENVAAILLAAGSSSRFGSGDKLSEPLHGIALGLHAARMLAGFPFLTKIVVTRDNSLDYRLHGFEPVINADPRAGQSSSIRTGVAMARVTAPKAILIALADMPLVMATHIDAMLARSDEEHLVVASTTGGVVSPPALFRAPLFDALGALSGDQGARHLLRTGTLVTAPPSTLNDIDTLADLAILTGGPTEQARDL